ncbi:uncharacterized protein LOC110838280 [Zootermopsis nevadensis]|uniref:Uncharacterized protein n=1 Tax=Zootermopsis nevadensis TaxID=136037 RepID=A0A067QLC9_ZOONE|nr:uncharacterized protein LOC110838280 [Zootermopsis nevadensis]KDR10091.1 hypothetical protein L798_15328 [Zootermopsis nevadensis]
MKTVVVFALLLGLAAATDSSLNFTVFGVGDPVIYPDLQRHIAPYPGVLFSELTYYDAKPTDNYPNLPVYASPYTTSYNPVYSRSPSLSQYFRPYNQEYFNFYDLILNSGILKQLYPRLRTQYLNHFSRLQTSRLGLYPLLNVNGLVQQFNPSYNSLISKIYNNFKNIRNGPVTVFVQSKEDPTKLDAIVIQQGLETLGKSRNTAPLLEAIEATTGVKAAFLFNPINIPASSQKVSVSRYIIPSGMTLSEFAKLAVLAPDTPFLLIIDANSPSASEIKALYQTFKIGKIEVTGDSVNVIPQFPVQTGHYQPQSPVSPQFPVPTGSVESPFSSSSTSSVASGSQSASQYTPQNPNINQASSSPASDGLNVNSNQAAPTSSISSLSAV